MKKKSFLEEAEKTKLSHFSLSKPLKMKKSWVNQEVKPFLDNPNHELMIKTELRTEIFFSYTTNDKKDESFCLTLICPKVH